MFLDDLAQRGIDILGHTACVAADKKLRAFAVDPFPNLARILEHEVLDINLVSLIARPRAIEPGENAVALEASPILFVGVVAGLALRSVEEPVFSLRAERLALLQEGAKGRDARARSDHDQGHIGIFRQVKMLGRAGITRHRHVVRALRHE